MPDDDDPVLDTTDGVVEASAALITLSKSLRPVGFGICTLSTKNVGVWLICAALPPFTSF